MNACICQSGKDFSKCCSRFLYKQPSSKQQYAKTPEQLMRSRYSAYALGGYGQYLLDTWLPTMTQGLSAFELSLKNTDWLGLQVINKSQQGDNATVEFIARYMAKDDEELHHELSTFKRIQGRWYYVDAEVREAETREPIL